MKLSYILWGMDRYYTTEQKKTIITWVKDRSFISLIREWVKSKKINDSKLHYKGKCFNKEFR